MWTRKLYHTPKSSKAGNESWTNARKNQQGNQFQSRNMAEAIHRYEHREHGWTVLCLESLWKMLTSAEVLVLCQMIEEVV